VFTLAISLGKEEGINEGSSAYSPAGASAGMQVPAVNTVPRITSRLDPGREASHRHNALVVLKRPDLKERI
jgi:hypothetical protein